MINNFANNLTYLRKGKKLSQHQLAKEIGLVRMTINYYESGKRAPNLDVLVLLANYFSIDLNTLVCGKVEENTLSIKAELKMYQSALNIIRKISKQYSDELMDIAILFEDISIREDKICRTHLEK